MFPRSSRFLFCFPLVCLAALAWLVPGGGTPRATPPQDAFAEKLEDARSLLRRRQYDDALKVFKKANDLRDRRSAECFFGMAQAYDGLGAFKNMVESCEKAALLAGEDAPFKARALNLKALGLLSWAQGKDEKRLHHALAALELAAQADPQLAIVRFNRGVALLRLERDAEGIAELRAYLQRDARGKATAEARKFIENPRRAREPFSPEFSVTTTAGEHISSDDLLGKVVLLDFWGTWCPPCVESVPALRDVHKRYGKDKFVMIAVSTDNDEDVWRSFIAKERMVWPQYLDRERSMVRKFDVDSFPTYILIDHEGVIRYRSSGASWTQEAQMDSTIKRTLKKLEEWERMPRPARAAAPPAPPPPLPEERQATGRSPASAPQSKAGDAEARELPDPALTVSHSEVSELHGRKTTRIFFSVSNWADYPDALFEPSPDLPPCGANANSSRTWVRVENELGRQIFGYCALGSPSALSRLSLVVPEHMPVPSQIRVVLRDRRTSRAYLSNLAAVPPPAAPPS